MKATRTHKTQPSAAAKMNNPQRWRTTCAVEQPRAAIQLILTN
jgi:hypothetical protein